MIAVAALGSGCFNGGGPGNFDLPTTSKPASTSFVRAYQQCTAPNAMTNWGLPSCAPGVALSSYHFGPKGYCALKTATKLTAPCQYADPANGSCFDELGTIECVDVRDAGDTLITSADGWVAHMAYRATGREKNGNADMTMGDVGGLPNPATSVSLVAPGSLEFKAAASAVVRFFAAMTDLQEPSDLNVELLNAHDDGVFGHVLTGLGVTLSDPDGNPFAAMGGATAPGDACSLNAPAKGKAKGTKASLVRAYSPCQAPNTTTTPLGPLTSGACTPPVPVSPDYVFGPKGTCTLALQHKAAACSAFPAGGCHALTVLKCKDVRDAGTSLPITNDGWKMFLTVRVTEDEGTGSETLIDVPVVVDVPPAKKGSLGAKVSSATTVMGLLGPGFELPACASMQLLSAELLDPTNQAFATIGRATNVD